MIFDRLIMLPSDEGFNEILNGSLPSDFDGSQCVVQRSTSGLLETVSYEEAIEYALGGEYDEVDDFDEELGDE
ncbi:MAG: hypothetical protein WCK98_08225 [bacterium]